MSEARWRAVRASLNGRRDELGRAAAALYPGAVRVGATSLLTRPEWVPAAPIPLDAVRLDWDPAPAAPAVTGAEPLPGHATYAEAVAALAPPAVFEDRPAYRLVAADLIGDPALRFSAASYFDGVNVGEAAAHELAAGTGGLPLRTRVGDPCDLSRRTALTAVTTLTLRRHPSGRADFVLHWRDPAKVAHAGGLHQVMPVGVFQPATDPVADLDLWRTMAREFSEEFLGAGEDYEAGFSYESGPFFGELAAARRAGLLRVHCLGLGVDPLTFAVDLLTVAVFEAGLFDALFGGLVSANSEGLVSVVPFDERPHEPMQPAGAAVLELARRHRAALL